MKKPKALAVIVSMVLVTGSCSGGPSEQELEQIAALRTELSSVEKELTQAVEENDRLSGGLVKALVQVRLQVLGVTKDLLQQRIHAIESGARITTAVPATAPDSILASKLEIEISAQERQLEAARAEANRYSGGLVHAMALSTVATQAQSLALLRQRYLTAKYGLGTPSHPATAAPSPGGSSDLPEADAREDVIHVKLLRKRYSEQDYQDHIWFDLEHTADGLDKPARAIKGALLLTDLFGEVKMRIGWTLDDGIQPAQVIIERNVGFEYNQFMDDHQWVRGTSLENMAARFRVESILYRDGTRRDFDD